MTAAVLVYLRDDQQLKRAARGWRIVGGGVAPVRRVVRSVVSGKDEESWLFDVPSEPEAHDDFILKGLESVESHDDSWLVRCVERGLGRAQTPLERVEFRRPLAAGPPGALTAVYALPELVCDPRVIDVIGEDAPDVADFLRRHSSARHRLALVVWA
jgi:hypothetical protein